MADDEPKPDIDTFHDDLRDSKSRLCLFVGILVAIVVVVGCIGRRLCTPTIL